MVTVTHSTRIASVFLVSLLAACGGKSFDQGTPQGGSDPGGTGQGGSGPVGGTAHGGSISKGGAPAGGTGQGGDTTCQAYDDQPATYIQVNIYNQTTKPIYLGQDMVDCGVAPLFAIQDASGATLGTGRDCRQPCQQVRNGGALGCPAICAYPQTVALQPGEVLYTSWDGLFMMQAMLPEQCLATPDYGGSCDMARAIQPGSFTFTSQAGLGIDCSDTIGSCQPCMPNGEGGCVTPASVITGEHLKAETSVLLDASFGVYGPLPAPVPAYPGGDAPGGAVALRAVELFFTE